VPVLGWDGIRGEIIEKLGGLVEEKLLVGDADEFRITELGWIWCVDMMYFLSSASDQAVLDDFVALKRRTKGLVDGDNRMLPLLESAR
jgi:anaerobilin synthase